MSLLVSGFFKASINYANLAWGGLGAITGTVKIGTTGVKRRVRLYDANTGLLLCELWSASDGSYTFTGLRTDLKYTLSALDYSHSYADVISANTTTGATIDLVLGSTPDSNGVVITTDVNASPVYSLRNLALAVFNGGLGAISGSVQINHVPVKTRLRLYEANNGYLLWELWSNSDGSYCFAGLNRFKTYTVTAIDTGLIYNDAIVSDITIVDLPKPLTG